MARASLRGAFLIVWFSGAFVWVGSTICTLYRLGSLTHVAIQLCTGARLRAPTQSKYPSKLPSSQVQNALGSHSSSFSPFFLGTISSPPLAHLRLFALVFSAIHTRFVCGNIDHLIRLLSTAPTVTKHSTMLSRAYAFLSLLLTIGLAVPATAHAGGEPLHVSPPPPLYHPASAEPNLGRPRPPPRRPARRAHPDLRARRQPRRAGRPRRAWGQRHRRRQRRARHARHPRLRRRRHRHGNRHRHGDGRGRRRVRNGHGTHAPRVVVDHPLERRTGAGPRGGLGKLGIGAAGRGGAGRVVSFGDGLVGARFVFAAREMGGVQAMLRREISARVVW